MNLETIRSQAELCVEYLRRSQDARHLAGLVAFAAAFLFLTSPWLIVPTLFILGFSSFGWFPFACAARSRRAASLEVVTERTDKRATERDLT